jgi:hypothetical protein
MSMTFGMQHQPRGNARLHSAPTSLEVQQQFPEHAFMFWLISFEASLTRRPQWLKYGAFYQ